ncbi:MULTISPECIES: DNA polymerase III subunit beta [Priestia]|jgi:DNA polymerase III subunit beta|uniref:Beta sliding clamp n=11 Tax=Priestia TaxID=2800373 RepID=D5DUQ9_PRIM1|nr:MULTISPECIES: DNA polymerase III subunit beta [Priestia]AVX06247.1 DNA polymerase III subunit beta [Bacillus sp. Y-01]KQU21520.1 DNA polymerase III subunit beta [Bacillus sp. Leaf75]KRD83086.1 DNA polymerase III subunit beta [Bacillus sp. Root147]KRF47354.1 DNA polymerase III subunit beta [Bacillus sp. Soil531]MBK0295915.1 DNA polymerase III subunit beta [Bacillus sp. S34]MBZ5481689.1 DNA polymerase III subunit beta [Bacillus sp. T_4]MCF6799134.1 DNA polymerase III subunit beta [Bacillus 
MKFIIQKDYLVQSVQDVMKAVSSRTTIPILTGIKIVATEEGVTLTGSDSDISIESFIPNEEEGKEIVDIQKPGSVVLPARFFSEIVKKLPKDIVELDVQSHFLTIIRSGKAEFNLNGLDAEEYPHLPQIEENNMFRLPTDLLKNMIRQTVFAVSTSETRPILTGVNWKVDGKELTCIATDSHRLALRKATIETGNEATYNVVIPGKSLSEFSKILDDSHELVDIVITENQVLFKTKHLLFFSRLLDGNYPDTSRLIPADSKTDVILNVKEFLQSIDRASLLAREGRNNVVKLSTLDEGIVEISSNSPEIGKVIEEVQSQSISGEELKISFSAKYMLDALKALEGTDIKINFTGAMRPFVIRTLEDDSMLQLILPVRTY